MGIKMKRCVLVLLSGFIMFSLFQCENPSIVIEPEETGSLYVSRKPVADEDDFKISFHGDLVSLQSQNVLLSRLVKRIIQQYRLPVVFPGDLRGRITVSLNDLNHIEVLKIILESHQYSLEKNENVFIIKKEMISGDITREILLKYLDAATLCQSLKATYGNEIKMTPVPEHNALIASGDAEKIKQLDEAIASLDRPSPSILLEIVLLEVNKTRLDEFGVSLTDLASKKLAVKSYNPSGAITETLSDLELKGDLEGEVTDSFLFKMNIQALTKVGLAKIVTHPHVVCRSGEKAKVEVSLDNYIHIMRQTTDSMHFYFDVQKIEAGVVLEVTPTITNSGLIHINFSAQESNIALPVSNAAFTIDRNTLSSSLLSRDGEVMVAGGLVQKMMYHETSAVPFLEKVPILNLLFKNRGHQKEVREVVFYIIPKKFHHEYKPFIKTESVKNN